MKFSCGCEFEKLDFDNVNLECKATWELIGDGLTKGLFQIEGSLGKRYCKSIKPENIEELAAVISLIRPGCLEAEYREVEGGKMLSITDTYVKTKRGDIQPEYIDTVLEPIFKSTYGVPVYQEQIMQICTDFAGFTMQEADTTRKAVGKKLIDVMAEVEEKFIKGSIKRGHSEELARTVFSWIDKFSGYGFNKCLIGDTKLNRGTSNKNSDGMYSIGHLYKLVNDYDYARDNKQIHLRKKLRSSGYGNCMAVCADGRIRPMPIKTIHFNGKKKIVKITDSEGRIISCTLDHKFMMPNGKMKAIGDIGVDGEVVCHINKYDNEKIYDYSMHNTKERGSKAELLDTIGRKNGSFIGGNWAKFRDIQEKYSYIDYCQICNIKSNRFEWHHIDADRLNNTEDNLIKLCVSCHKKEDYKLGRNKRFDKGHKAEIVTIVSIEKLEEELDTYDVEMDTPEHNWIADGFAVSNSHGISYAFLGYWGAYAKVHFPLEFFKNKLAFSDSNPDEFDEIKQLVHEAKLFDIKVTPPSIDEMNIQFKYLGDNALMFGLAHIKGVGVSALKEVKKLGKIRGEHDLFSKIFVDGIKIKKNVVEALIKSGAVPALRETRVKSLARYMFLHLLTDRERKYLYDNDVMIDEPSIGSMINTLIKNNVTRGEKRTKKVQLNFEDIKLQLSGNTRKMILAWEKFHLGMPLSGSEVELYSNYKVNTTCRDFLKIRNKSQVCMGVIIESIKAITDKKGNRMCFMSLSDNTYMIDSAVVFSRAYKNCSWIIEQGKPVLISGTKNDTSLFVNKIEHL